MKFGKSILLALLVVGFAGNLLAENTNLVTDLRALIGRINTKLTAGKMAEADFTDNIKEFDSLLAKYKSDPSGEAEMIAQMKLKLYLEVFDDPEGAVAVFKQIKDNFPKTKLDVDAAVASLQPAVEKQKIRRALVEGVKFPDFDEKDLNDKPLSIASRKGKVVLVDFWATWCVPCREELPNVIATYKKHHEEGFEIIGVSLDADRAQLDRFLPAAGMTWPQFFDGNQWENKLAVKYGINKVPATYLLDRDGKIIGHNLRGSALEAAVTKALKK